MANKMNFTKVGEANIHTRKNGQKCFRLSIDPQVKTLMPDHDFEKIYVFGSKKTGKYTVMGMMPDGYEHKNSKPVRKAKSTVRQN